MIFFKYLFYKFYRLAIALGNEGFYPEVNAWFLLNFLLWINYATILILLKLYLGLSKQGFKYLLIASIPFWIVLWIYFMKKDHYKSILAEFEKEPKTADKKWFFLMILYSLLSIGTYLFVDRL